MSRMPLTCVAAVVARRAHAAAVVARRAHAATIMAACALAFCALFCILACGCTPSADTASGGASSGSSNIADHATPSESQASTGTAADSATADEQRSAESAASISDALPYTCAGEAGYDLANVSFSQLVLVDSDGTEAQVTCYEKDADGIFRAVEGFGAAEGYVGTSGVGAPHEGSSTTPAGLFDLPFAFGNAEDPGTQMRYLAVDEDSWWSCETGTGTYNAFVESGHALGGNSEHLRSVGSYYDYAVVIGYNHPLIGSASPDVVEDAGSGFFLHISDEPTEGCVGIDRSHMLAIMLWLSPAADPHILIV